jgi:hypothetical protein
MSNPAQNNHSAAEPFLLRLGDYLQTLFISAKLLIRGLQSYAKCSSFDRNDVNLRGKISILLQGTHSDFWRRKGWEQNKDWSSRSLSMWLVEMTIVKELFALSNFLMAIILQIKHRVPCCIVDRRTLLYSRICDCQHPSATSWDLGLTYHFQATFGPREFSRWGMIFHVSAYSQQLHSLHKSFLPCYFHWYVPACTPWNKLIKNPSIGWRDSCDQKVSIGCFQSTDC